jgi:U3 small nucleolar RNA-associated protein 3
MVLLTSLAEEFLQPSDEEVLGYESASSEEDDLEDEDEDDLDEGDEGDEDEDDDDDYASRKASKKSGKQPDDDDEEEAEDGIGAWGSSRKDYYNADAIETEADALEEEEEAKKLQQKHLKAMKEADFGFDETDWLQPKEAPEESKKGEDGVVTEVLPQLEITDDMGPEERLKILKSRYPEFEPLAKDLVDLEPIFKDLQQAAQAAEEAITDFSEPTPVPVVKFRALAAYLGSISMYFALLTSPSQNGDGKALAMPPAELREHPVMQSLVECKKLWDTVKDLRVPDVSEVAEVDGTDEEMEDVEQALPVATIQKPKKRTKEVKPPKEKKTKAQRAAEAAAAEAEARRAEKLRQTEAELADLSQLVTKKSKASAAKVSKKDQDNDGSDFGDEQALTAQEAEEKAKRKRSLRFYTSQIAQKANKRDAAGRDAGGDLDLPYRERLRDRQARLNAEAEKRGRKQADAAEQLGGDSDEEDHQLAAEVRGHGAGSGADEDEYYDMVAARSKQKKAEKQARAEAFAEAAREGGHVEVQAEIGPDGKRAITYQIEKNRGLAPKRKKDVRNPRVKKRKKFEEKQKKLGSFRQVFKGGEGRGGYGGELTGIKKNLVKSVKL